MMLARLRLMAAFSTWARAASIAGRRSAAAGAASGAMARRLIRAGRRGRVSRCGAGSGRRARLRERFEETEGEDALPDGLLVLLEALDRRRVGEDDDLPVLLREHLDLPHDDAAELVLDLDYPGFRGPLGLELLLPHDPEHLESFRVRAERVLLHLDEAVRG